jgi:hypothetical protein
MALLLFGEVLVGDVFREFEVLLRSGEDSLRGGFSEFVDSFETSLDGAPFGFPCLTVLVSPEDSPFSIGFSIPNSSPPSLKQE